MDVMEEHATSILRIEVYANQEISMKQFATLAYSSNL
jgi:hypothetical protein